MVFLKKKFNLYIGKILNKWIWKNSQSYYKKKDNFIHKKSNLNLQWSAKESNKVSIKVCYDSNLSSVCLMLG